jgi:hypothetical protein
VSGRTCAEAILDGAPLSYGKRLATNPTLRDYALTRDLLRVLVGLRRGRTRAAPGRLARAAAVRGFAWMFSGRRIPGGTVLRAAVRLGGGRIS